jgi:hypothetical protein
MFGRSRSISFQPYGSRRSRGRPPRWLVLLLFGIALGAGGLYLLQERYLPPRLSAAQSAQLQTAFDTAEGERRKLAAKSSASAQRLAATLAENKTLTQDLSAARANVESLREDLGMVVAALPPDPRGAPVEVRAARFAARGGALGYDLLLTRDRAVAGKPIAASMQLVVAGESARGTPVTFNPPAEPVTIGALQVMRGSVALPEGLKPRRVTVQVLNRAGGKPIGMRVLLVR